MKKLIEHIEYLILTHDCVSVPGIGAFIAQNRGADIDLELNRFFPPRRTVSFNADLQHNDGMVITSIARKEQIPYSKATEVLENEINSFRSELKASGSVTFGALGTFSVTADDKLLFSPSDSSISKRLIGLESFPLTRLSAIREAEKPEKDVYYVPISRNIFKMAASILLVLALGIVLSTPIIDHSAVFASIGSTVKEHTLKAETVPAEMISPDIDLSIALPDPATSMAEWTPDTLTTKDVADKPESLHRYYLIVASLPNKVKAEEFLSRHRTEIPDMQILPSPTRYRIYVADGSSYAEAARLLSSKEFAGKHPDAWVYKK